MWFQKFDILCFSTVRRFSKASLSKAQKGFQFIFVFRKKTLRIYKLHFKKTMAFYSLEDGATMSRHDSNGSSTLAASAASSNEAEGDEFDDEVEDDIDDINATANERESDVSNPEDPMLYVLNNLDEETYVKEPLAVLPKEVPDIIKLVSIKGILPYSWNITRKAIRLQMRQQFHLCWQTRGYEDPDSTELTFEKKVEQVVGMLDKFEDDGGPPFTIQRIAELALNGLSTYTSTKKLFRAFEKCLLVEMTMDSVDEDCTIVEHKDSYFFKEQEQVDDEIEVEMAGDDDCCTHEMTAENVSHGDGSLDSETPALAARVDIKGIEDSSTALSSYYSVQSVSHSHKRADMIALAMDLHESERKRQRTNPL